MTYCSTNGKENQETAGKLRSSAKINRAVSV